MIRNGLAGHFRKPELFDENRLRSRQISRPKCEMRERRLPADRMPAASRGRASFETLLQKLN